MDHSQTEQCLEELKVKDAELIVGLAGPIGADINLVCQELTRALTTVSYDTHTVHLTGLLPRFNGFESVEGLREDERYAALIEAGNRFRRQVGTPAAMAGLAAEAIARQRLVFESAGVRRRAFLVRQLKRPEEVQELRAVYGPRFILAAALGDREQRTEALANRIAESVNEMDGSKFMAEATNLIKVDEHEDDIADGQNLRDTFAEADVFLATKDPNLLRRDIDRLIGLLFGLGVSTPTMDEYAMFMASGAAMRSGSLARQVGAVVADSSGCIVATGTNDVPRAGGGLYWEGQTDDCRDHVLGHDPSDRLKQLMLSQLFDRLLDGGWLAAEHNDRSGQDLAALALSSEDLGVSSSRVNSVIEYVRAAHAEQAALIDAGRRGVPLQDKTMLVTTFPCHECARLIVLSGIERVVYIEPYQKSLAPLLYSDSIAFGHCCDDRVQFEQFAGIAPRQYVRLFSMEGMKRKDSNGRILSPDREMAQLRAAPGTIHGSPEAAEAKLAAVVGWLETTR